MAGNRQMSTPSEDEDVRPRPRPRPPPFHMESILATTYSGNTNRVQVPSVMSRATPLSYCPYAPPYHPYHWPSLAPPRRRRPRTVFSSRHIAALEDKFAKNKYLTVPERQALSVELGLTQQQVKTWFQNRRTKWKKELDEQDRKEVAADQKQVAVDQREVAADQRKAAVDLREVAADPQSSLGDGRT